MAVAWAHPSAIGFATWPSESSSTISILVRSRIRPSSHALCCSKPASSAPSFSFLRSSCTVCWEARKGRSLISGQTRCASCKSSDWSKILHCIFKTPKSNSQFRSFPCFPVMKSSPFSLTSHPVTRPLRMRLHLIETWRSRARHPTTPYCRHLIHARIWPRWRCKPSFESSTTSALGRISASRS